MNLGVRHVWSCALVIAIAFATLIALPTMVTAQTHFYKYKDDDGNAHFTQDPGAVPPGYRDSIEEINVGPEPEPSLLERLNDLISRDDQDLPPERQGLGRAGSRESKRSNKDQGGTVQKMGSGKGGKKSGKNGGSVGSATVNQSGGDGNGKRGDGGRQNSGGDNGAPDLGVNADNVNINIPELKEKLSKYNDSPLFQKLIIAMVAAFESGYLWVVLLALVLAGFILATRKLIYLEDSGAKRLFWKWGFPPLSALTIYVLYQITYPAYTQIYTELLQAIGL